ncbi:hypothetical protein HY990_06005 [Candidatus Micrarchaeota archaeon]|nr:hypothetical protein [Candidatus Micrarchaeota archaeon]
MSNSIRSPSSTIKIGACIHSVDLIVGTLNRGPNGVRPGQIETPFGPAAIMAGNALIAPPTFLLPAAFRGSDLRELPYLKAGGPMTLARIKEIEPIDGLPVALFMAQTTCTEITAQDRARLVPILLEAVVHALNSGDRNPISDRLPERAFVEHPLFGHDVNSRRLVAVNDSKTLLAVSVGFDTELFELSHEDIAFILEAKMRQVELSGENLGAFRMTFGVFQVPSAPSEKTTLEQIQIAVVQSVGSDTRQKGKKLSDLVSFADGAGEKIKVKDGSITGVVRLMDGRTVLVTTKSVDELVNTQLEVFAAKKLALATPDAIKATLEDGRAICIVPIVKIEAMVRVTFGDETDALRGLDPAAVKLAAGKAWELGGNRNSGSVAQE